MKPKNDGNTPVQVVAQVKYFSQERVKIGGLPHINSSIETNLTRFLARTFKEARSTCTPKNFSHSSYIFGMITHLLMNKRFH